jgi:hypothetical protein
MIIMMMAGRGNLLLDVGSERGTVYVSLTYKDLKRHPL